jgi:cytochrome c oxidase subunit 2
VRAAHRVTAVAVVAALAAGGCLPRIVTTEGHDIAATYRIFLLAAAIVALIVVGSATFAIVRYRRRDDDDTLPVQTRGNVKAEAIWTLLPALTVVGLFVLTVLTLLRVDPADAGRAPGDGEAYGAEVEVTAFRWGWTFSYPREDVTISGIGAPGPEIHVPAGEPILFRITAADVIHSFYVPVFLQKRDANPGRENVMRVTIEEAGTYRGQCAEFCGIYHHRMPFAIVAEPREAFDAWLAAQPRGAQPGVPIGSPLASGSPQPSPSEEGQPPESSP